MIHTLDLHFLGNERAISAFLIKTDVGPILVECGPHSTWDVLVTALAQHQTLPEEIQHVFLSHIHFDHAGAAWAFAQHGAKIYVHPKGAAHLAQPERLYQSARMIYGDQMDTLWGAMEPIEPSLIHQPEHGETIQIGDYQFSALYTPGHAVHHIAWQCTHVGSKDAIIFTGDVAGVKIDHGPVMPPCPPPDILIEDWLNSIEILREAKPTALYLTHFGRITDVDAHLTALALELKAWAAWIRPYFEAQTDQSEIVPKFEQFVEQRLSDKGVDKLGLARYQAANPAFMSVAGLMRYWFKKAQAESTQSKA
jgi:glyoxylase-like metal-dependent hydrolase (beta-lactamase superfamily II)